MPRTRRQFPAICRMGAECRLPIGAISPFGRQSRRLPIRRTPWSEKAQKDSLKEVEYEARLVGVSSDEKVSQFFRSPANVNVERICRSIVRRIVDTRPEEAAEGETVPDEVGTPSESVADDSRNENSRIENRRIENRRIENRCNENHCNKRAGAEAAWRGGGSGAWKILKRPGDQTGVRRSPRAAGQCWRRTALSREGLVGDLSAGSGRHLPDSPRAPISALHTLSFIIVRPERGGGAASGAFKQYEAASLGTFVSAKVKATEEGASAYIEANGIS